MVLPINKGKGNPMERGLYRGIKLLEHAMKVVDRIFEHRIRQQIEIDDMQFGFMKGKGTTDAIFMARQMQENFYRAMLCILGTSHGPVSVRLSVRPSQVGVLLKQLNVGSHKQHHTIAQGL